MPTKPTLWLFATGSIAVIYLVQLVINETTGGPVLPPHINTAVVVVLAISVMVALIWCIRESSTARYERRIAQSIESIKTHMDEWLTSIVNVMIEHSYRVSAEADATGVALKTDVARVESAIDELARDRDLQVARLYDAIGEVRKAAEVDLSTNMKWVVRRFDEKP